MERLEKQYDVIVVGGGLAGLSAAAHLAKNGKKVILMEKAKIGGRAMTVKIKGYEFNMGAHAFYGRDTSTLHTLEKELQLKMNWAEFSPDKAIYDLGQELTVIPSSLKGLMETKMLTGCNKFSFAWFVLLTMLGFHKGSSNTSISEWMEEQKLNDEIKTMLLTLASSNFFTNKPEQIPSDVFFNYYKKIFRTQKPVSYLRGGWQNLIEQLTQVIEENDGEILTKAKLTEIKIEDGKIESLLVGDEKYIADDYIFCIPPDELHKVFKGTILEPRFMEYSNLEPTYVMFYDIGLKESVNSSYTYVYDTKNKLFITDISYYDPNCAPENGQLLQAIAYVNKEEAENPEMIEQYKEKIEAFYDKHFAGWRESLVVPKISKKAIVQTIKWNMSQQGIPISFEDISNLYFAGDWCSGEGQLSELSFSSAYHVSKLIQRNQQ
ncbi:phytoene desaturase family protein [Bacillus cereus]